MPQVTGRWIFDGRFEVQAIQVAEKQWIRLSAIEPARLLTFWSSTEGADISLDRVLGELAERLRLVAAGKCALLDAIEWWPEGWEYWGAGVPQPLLQYLSSIEYQDEARTFPALNWSFPA